MTTSTNLCKIQVARWKKTERSLALLNQNHRYSAGTDEIPIFARLDEWWSERPTSNLRWKDGRKIERGCACGGPSAWACFAKVYSRKALGGERVTRTGRGYTVFPDDADINAAILGTANKFIEPMFENGLPCEEFRDLCNELVLELHTYSTGMTTTYFLPKSAAAYLRAKNASQTMTTSYLHKGRKP